VLARYERIAFDKEHIAGPPVAAFVCPGHPLLDATLDLTLERHRDLLRRGSILVDVRDPSTRPRVLFYLEHAIQDASLTRTGERRTISKRMLYVELSEDGGARHLQIAPYLDYRPLQESEPQAATILARPEVAFVAAGLEQRALGHAITQMVPEHLQEVRGRIEERVAKTRVAVQERLTKEISFWDHRAEELKSQERAGRPNARLNSQEARRRADDLQARMQKRLAELDMEGQVSALPPVVLGGALVVPVGLLAHMAGQSVPEGTERVDTQAVAAHARTIVMEAETRLGFQPQDREFEKLGYDIESHDAGTGKLRFIEVKGRVSGAPSITVTRNEILYSLNKPEDFILAIVEFMPDDTHRLHYIRRPFQNEPDFALTSSNYSFADLLTRAEAPS
jgi:hypothetical protein